MQKTINHLVQLQELIVARAQQEASQSTRNLADLDNAIESLFNELPDSIQRKFQQLRKRHELCIVPLSQQVCTGCGMKLPLSFVQDVRSAEDIYHCPNCARLVYFTEGLPRRAATKTSRFEAPKVGIARFSSQSLMIPRLQGATADEVLAELAHQLEQEGFVDNAERLTQEALNREAIVSTAVDHQLAFPHVRGVEGGGLAMVLGLHRKGVDFGSPSGKLTRVFFFMIIPTAASAFYLKLLSGLTQAFREKEARDLLMLADSPEDLWKTLIKATRNTVS